MTDQSLDDVDTLRRLYYDEGLTQAEIAERFGVSQMAVSLKMQEFGINPGQTGLGESQRKLVATDPDEVGGDV